MCRYFWPNWRKYFLHEYTNYLLILLSISYRLLSIEVINGSLPTREVYQYNHRWSVAHNVKILSKEQKCRILSKRNDRRKSNKTISLKDAFKILDVYSYNLTLRMIYEQFGEQIRFQSIDLYIAESHAKCVGDNSANSCMKSQQVWIAKQIIHFWSVMKVAQQ